MVHNSQFILHIPSGRLDLILPLETYIYNIILLSLNMRCYLIAFFVLLLQLTTSSSSHCTCSCDSERMDEVGRAGWRFLHTLAANYPEKPHFHQKYAWYGLYETVATFYPCEKCREHLWDNIVRHGVHVQNRTDLSMYLCWLHNDVNKENGKELFPCEMDILMEKYGFVNSTISKRLYLD